MTTALPTPDARTTDAVGAALLLERVSDVADPILDEAGIEVRREASGLAGAALRDALAGVGLLGIRSKSVVDAAVLDAADDLAAIGCFCIGTNQVDLDRARMLGIPVFNSPFCNTRSVAELTIAEIVALHRRLVEKSMLLHAGRWDKSAVGAHEVRGRVLGIVGYGHIGAQVSILAEAIGMRVIYHDVVPKLPLGNAEAVPTLEELLGRADVVTLHVPENESTRGLIGAEALARMKPGAFLINNARGTVVDLDAAADALRAGRLGGIAADVFPAEPATSDAGFACALAGLPNAILTPHVGGSTEEAQESIARDVASKLVRFAATGTTVAAVNVPEVELPRTRAGRRRILHFHRNVPGVLSHLHRAVADLGLNIDAEYLQSTHDVSYVILDVDPAEPRALLDRLRIVPETIRVRLL